MRSNQANASLGQTTNPTGSHNKTSRTSLKKRRPRRVLYPAHVRKYLPREETDQAKKWVVILGFIVLLQVYLEDGSQCDNKTIPIPDNDLTLPQNFINTTVARTFLATSGDQLSRRDLANVSKTYDTIFFFMTKSRGKEMTTSSRPAIYDGAMARTIKDFKKKERGPLSRFQLDSICT